MTISKTITLTRKYYDKFTTGMLTLQGSSEVLYTLELPYRNNEVNISCIPEGEYFITPYFSQLHSKCFKVYQNEEGREVNGRSGILIHKGNSIIETKGCILVGKKEYISSQVILENGGGVRKGLSAMLEYSKIALEALFNYHHALAMLKGVYGEEENNLKIKLIITSKMEEHHE